MRNAEALRIGLWLIPLGFGGLFLGAAFQSIVLILLGTALTSASSYGLTYLAALSEVAMLSPDNRARATAGLFVYAYCGFSIPVILAGLLADQFGLVPAMAMFLFLQTGLLSILVIYRRRIDPEGISA